MLSFKAVDNAVMRAALSNLREQLLIIIRVSSQGVELVDTRSGEMDTTVVYKIVLLLAQVEQVIADADYVKQGDSFLHDTAMDIWRLLLSSVSQRAAATMVDDLISTLIRFKCGECPLSSLLDRLDHHPPDHHPSRCSDGEDDQWSAMGLEVLHLLPFFCIARALKATAQSRPPQEEEGGELRELATRRLPFDRLLRLSASASSLSSSSSKAAAMGGLQIFFCRLSLVSSFVIKWLKVGCCFEDKAKQQQLLVVSAFTQAFVQSLVEVVIAIPSTYKSSQHSQHASTTTISSSQHMSHIVRHVGSLLSVCFSASSEEIKGTSMMLIVSMQAAVVDEIERIRSVREAGSSHDSAILHALLDTMSSLDSMCLLVTMKTHVLEYIQSPQLMQSFFRFVQATIPHAQRMVSLLASECKGEQSKVLRNAEQHNSKLLQLVARSSVKHLFPTAALTDLSCTDGLLAAFSASTDSVIMRRFRSLFCWHLMTSLNAELLTCIGGGDCSHSISIDRDRTRDRLSIAIRKLYRVGDTAEHHLVTRCDDPTQYDWLLMELRATAVVDLHYPNDEQAASTLSLVMEHLQTILANLALVSVSADSDHDGITDTNGSSSAVQQQQQQRLVLLFRAAVLSSMLSHHHARHQHQHQHRVSDHDLQLTHSLKYLTIGDHIASYHTICLRRPICRSPYNAPLS